MSSNPTPESPAPPPASDPVKAPWRHHVSWILMCSVWAIPASCVSTCTVVTAGERLGLSSLWGFHYGSGPWALFWIVLILCLGVGWLGIKRGWNSPVALRKGWRWGAPLALLVVLFLMINASAARLRPSSVDKAVLNNARMLAAASREYFSEHPATTCTSSDLIGPEKYLKALSVVAQETYPLHYTQGMAITVTGVAGARTITYAP